MSELCVVKADQSAHTPWLRDGATKWEVTEDFSLYGITVPSGYIFNGSSVPRFLWWLYPPTYAPAWEASCIHDYCYSHHWPYIGKKEADRIFVSIMKMNGASSFTQRAFYWAVRVNVTGGNWE